VEQRTHKKINTTFWGKPLEISEGFAEVKLKTSEDMAVDEFGLIHGGTIFGLADYASMLAVNHPNVVLAGANVKFLKPVKVGDLLFARAHVVESKGRKKVVEVVVERKNESIFTGEFVCVVLEKHVLDS